MASSNAVSSSESITPIYLPPHHSVLYPGFVDLAQRLNYLGFSRDLDIVNANNTPGILLDESTTVNAWVYKLCMAYEQWDGTWFQDGYNITENEHKKRILKDAILQFRGSQTIDIERYWRIKCCALAFNVRSQVVIQWIEPMKEIFADEYARAVRDNLPLTVENWQYIMESKN